MTPAQHATLKAYILADANFNMQPHNSDTAYAIAAAYNQEYAPAFVVWASTVPASTVFDNIAWASFTPADVPDGTTLYTNRALLCQGKQFNLQTMLVGRDQIATGKTSLRNGLKDALQGVPAGTGGANLDAGWATVKAAIVRNVTILEKIFATGTGTAATPGDLVVEGPISYPEIVTAMGW